MKYPVSYRYTDKIVGSIDLNEEVLELIKLKYNLSEIYTFAYIEDGTIVPGGLT